MLTQQQRSMVAKAKKIHGNVKPCHNKVWGGSFTINEKRKELVLWFNTIDNGTHILKEKVV